MPRKPSLPRLLKRCKELLSLGDWDISIRYCTREDLPGNEDGMCQPSYEHRIADILIIDPSERDPSDDMRPYSIRETVLHECLHCIINMPDKLQEERAIISIARAFDSLL